MATLECKVCGTPVYNVSETVSAVTCHECVTDMMRQYDEPTIKRRRASEGYPKGWRFMKEFVYKDGTVYHRGVEQPDLKGSLDPTVIVAKPKKSRAQKAREKAEVAAEYAKIKKELKKETRKTVIRKLEAQLKRLQKQL